MDAGAIDGAPDLADVEELLIRGMPLSSIPPGARLYMETSNANAVRVFACRWDTCSDVLLGPGLPASAEIPIGDIDRLYGIEGVEDGQSLTLSLVLKTAEGAEICRDTVRVSVVKLEVKWETLESVEITEGNDHPSGTIGVRAFPDATAPSENWADQVIVHVDTTPAVEELPLFLRSYDPDDPSANDNIVDNNINGGDNRTSPNILNFQGQTDSSGILHAQFTLAHQPGDNHRVAATMKQSALDFLNNNNVPPSGMAQNPTDAQVDKFIGTLTSLLTVWRYLHVETDSMARPAFAQNTVNANWNEPRFPLGTLVLDVTDQSSGENFENGFIRISALGFPDIVVRIITYNNYSWPYEDTVELALTQTDWGARPTFGACTFSDDDLSDEANFTTGIVGSDIGTGNPPGGFLPLPDTSYLADHYKIAYIFPVVEPQHTSLGAVPFVKNMTNMTVAGPWSPVLPFRGLPVSTQKYWTAYVFSSFQAENTEDYDQEPTGTKGASTHNEWFGVPPNSPIGAAYTGICTVFIESLDDGCDEQSARRTVAHEIAHTLGVDHGTGLMDRIDQTDDFSPYSLYELRNYKGP